MVGVVTAQEMAEGTERGAGAEMGGEMAERAVGWVELVGSGAV